MIATLKRLFGLETRGVAWVHPPADPTDSDAWERYWEAQLAHGFGPPLFDMMCDDRDLIEVMRDEEMRSILCAGNGVSMEPRALAAAGFEVVALDLSARALEVAKEFPSSDKLLQVFHDLRPVTAPTPVEFVVGDVLDPSICSGPYDVIIERRTAQTYPDDKRGMFLEALAARLSEKGILISHCHDGGWRPPAKPSHWTESWFRENGWTVWKGSSTGKLAGRVAWLVTSTG
jgi:hypothetical protein